MNSTVRNQQNSSARWVRKLLATSALIPALAILPAGEALASYIGDGFITSPDLPGHWQGAEHKGWIRVEANDWPGRLRKIRSGSDGELTFNGPLGARPGGPGKFVVTLGINNPDLPAMRGLCASQKVIPELTFAESFDRSRPALDLGPRPAVVPEYWLYKLKNAVLADCPYADGAAEQAFVFTFKDNEWLNWNPATPGGKIPLTAKDIPDVRPIDPARSKAGIRDYLITWIGLATDSREDQCPKMNVKPGEDEFFKFKTAEEIAAVRARNGEKGVTAGSVDSENRGPHGLTAVGLPGIVPDPVLIAPVSDVADGIDLDGNDGSASPPSGIRAHRNFTAPDGRTGIDNQMYNVMGCVPGFRGKKGYRNQTSNARRADGNFTTIVEVSGIDDSQNDPSVEVAMLYSMDKPIRDNSGKTFIANYTFRPSADPQFTLYNRRVSGRIVDGVIETDKIAHLPVNLGQDPLLELQGARMRFVPQPDGSVKGLIAGYEDWKKLAMNRASGYSEGLFGYSMPGLWYALRRNADGMFNPLSGEFEGISTVYEIDTVPAFMTPAPPAPKASGVAIKSGPAGGNKTSKEAK